MDYWPFHLIVILFLFATGTVVGSFLNVCIYRIPWEKSVIWPSSHCPKCLRPIVAQDNIPIVSWFALRGECRNCGARIAFRYPFIEALVGLLFAGVYLVDFVATGTALYGLTALDVARVVYHLTFVALLVTATFIDYDLTIIPDHVTVPGMIFGLAVGTIFPAVRPEPALATSHWQGFVTGMIGLLAGGGLTYFVRTVGSLALRREAMGFGDVTLMAMIGAFLGWQAAVLTFFFSAFIGLGHAVWKIAKTVQKLWNRKKLASTDRELPLGPYLSMAAAVLMFSWRWLWPTRLGPYFQALHDVCWFLLGLDSKP